MCHPTVARVGWGERYGEYKGVIIIIDCYWAGVHLDGK